MTKITRLQSGRTTREPLTTRNRLTVAGKEPGFFYRFVSDVDDRLDAHLAIGYEFVDAAKHKVGNSRVDVDSNLGSRVYVSSGGTKQFLMRIPQEYYDEDAKAKEARIKATERAMQAPDIKNKYGKIEQYDKD